MYFVFCLNDNAYYLEQLQVALTSLFYHNKHAKAFVYLINAEPISLKHKNLNTIYVNSNQIKPSMITAYSLKVVSDTLELVKRPVAWLDTDVIIRGSLDNLFADVDGQTLKILYRPHLEENSIFNTGVFVLGYSLATRQLINNASQQALVNYQWFADQLYLYKAFKLSKSDINFVPLDYKFNDLGGRKDSFKESSLIWHSKRKHFLKEPFREEYLHYLNLGVFDG